MNKIVGVELLVHVYHMGPHIGVWESNPTEIKKESLLNDQKCKPSLLALHTCSQVAEE